MNALRLLPAWLWWLSAVLIVGGVQQYRVMATQNDLSAARAEWSKTLKDTAEANAAVILKQQQDRQVLADKLASLDETTTGKLTDAQQENERLRRLYGAADDERKRLRIEVRIARNDATVSAATGPGSVGDAASVELSAAAGSAVWDIRRAMIEDRAKIDYLQGYIRTVTTQAPRK